MHTSLRQQRQEQGQRGSIKRPPPDGHKPLVAAVYTPSPVIVDGVLDNPVWQDAPSYELHIPQALVSEGRVTQESGSARFAWDEQFFYVGLELEDSDLVAEGTSDAELHNLLGDCCELMIKPEDETWYWELHVTPAGRGSSLFFPGRGRLGLPSCRQCDCGLQVAARCRGILNDWRSRDQGWTAEMAMPIAELTAHGQRFEPGARWRVLVGRYNYSRYLTASRGPELTSAPQVTAVDFHRFEEYAWLELRR